MEALDRLEKHWRWWVVLFWLAAAILMTIGHWRGIQAFALPDTDDNMRIMQVRAWLDGQGWFDLRQYRLNPPDGANIHWSRLVDLPIAGIKLALMPLIGGAGAEKVAVTLAPLLPMAVAMLAMGFATRRLIAPLAFGLAIAILLCAPSTLAMWTPLRIDHHGWQLALLAWSVAALTDPKPARGGLVLGVSTALSLTIGLEMLLYLAVAGTCVALMWVRDSSEARRLAAYGASLAGGCSLGFVLFASYANRAPVCDALSPVWLSAMIGAGAVAVLLSVVPAASWKARLLFAAAGGAVVAGGFAWAWPGCLGPLEHASPELKSLWLDNVREARPLYLHGLETSIVVAALPVAGLIGYAVMLWRERRDPDRLALWAATAAPALLAALLLLWQSRAGPAAQLLAVPGATALGWAIIPRIHSSKLMLVRVLGTVAAFLLVSGILPRQAATLIPQKNKPVMKVVNRANALCPSLFAMRPVALVRKGLVLTSVDLGPRLITVTHHDAVAGPYHRNGQDIIDVMRAFRGSADEAKAIVDRRHIDYVLVCPALSETTVYASAAPKGFYVQINRGQLPAWLAPVPLPDRSPFKMWRVVKAPASSAT
ncbi:MAG: AcrB/AcrD/AcrF family protein [Alphaproteobacteria bacterium]|nr:AcrB/AcrD/AcrF family protein [Alphaproteobacteria bacterium]